MNDPLALQSDLKLISNWCCKSQLMLDKMKVYLFPSSRTAKYTVVSEALLNMYFDIHIMYNLPWATHIDAICVEASRLQHQRRNVNNSRNNLRELPNLTTNQS